MESHDAPNLRTRNARPSEFSFGFQPQLATGGVDVVAFFAAQRGDDLLLLQRGEKIFTGLFRRAFPCQTFHPVVGNQVFTLAKSLRASAASGLACSTESIMPEIKMYSNVIIRPFWL